jgi:ADP-Ribosyltransferase in polyvalent proteins
MFDYTNNFPLQELKPEASLLRLQAYAPTPEFQYAWQGQGTILDKKRMADPTAWGYDTDKREAMTREEYFAGQQLLSAESGGNTGLYGEYIHSSLGMDVTQGAVLRSIYFGADPLNAIQFAPSELPQTPEEEQYLADTLKQLINAEGGRQADPKNLSPNQQRIKEISDKLAYKKAYDRSETNLGVSLSRQILAQSSAISYISDLIGFTSTDTTGKLARNLDDVIKVRTRVDPTYSPTQWFNEKFSDPTVQQGLLDNGITAEFIADTTNADEAEYRIYRTLNQSDLQRRMSEFSPSAADTVRLASASLVAGFVNSPDIVIDAGEVVGGVALAVGGALLTPVTGGASLTGTAAGLALTATKTTNLFLKLKSVWNSSKALRAGVYTAETVLKLPMGFAPSYAKNLGLIGRVATPTALGFASGAATEYARQQNQMAYAAATMYADPDAVKEYSMSEVALTGLQSGIFGGALFGVAPNVLGSLGGAAMNGLVGVKMLSVDGTVIRDTTNKQFTFKGTAIGEAIESSSKAINKLKKNVVTDGPLQETMAAKAAIENKNPTAEEVVARTAERVDRVDVREVESAEKAESIPEIGAAKRYENETKTGYIERVGSSGLINNVFQFARELARKSPEAADNLKLSTDNWDQMTAVDKIRVFTDMKKRIEQLVTVESKTEGGISNDRAKVIATMETQRKALIKNLKKGLSQDQAKQLAKELKGGVPLEVPEALAAVRAAKNAAAKKEAASALAASLIEKAQQVAKQPEKADEIRGSVPQDLLDSFDEVSTEVNLKKNVSEDTVEAIKANVAGLKPPTKTTVSKFKTAIKNALLINKIDNVRMDKIRAVISDPTKFAEIVTGNKAKAQQFYEYINKLRMGKLISREDMDLILAATVHLNFDSKAFDIQFKVEQIKNADGSFATGIVGSYETNKKTLTMNLAWKSVASVEAAQRTRAMTVLHELGHAYFQHQAKGNIYKQVLDMYVKSVGLEAEILLTNKVYDLQDSLIANDFLNVYHLSNAEETFAETFSKILFTEAEFAVANLKPLQISMAQHVLNKITESVVLAANMWSSSKHYDAASKIIEDITKVDALLDDGVSVPKFVRVLATVIPSVTNRADFNRELTTRFGTSKYEVTDLEFELLDRLKNDDPALLVAFAIRKSEGRELKTQTDFNGLINTLIKYKKTQLSSLMMRTAFGIQVHTSKLIKNKTREERLAWFEDYFFNAYLKEAGEVPATKSGVSAPTYEDEYLSDIAVSTKVFPKETYASNYWLTNSNNFLSFIEEKGFDASTGYAHSGLTLSLIENLQNTYAQYDFTDMADGLVLAAHKKFVLGFNKTGLYNVVSLKTEVQTDTPEFTRWFANSKVLDADGKPLIVYHGTRATVDFNAFKVNKSGMFGKGIYASNDPEVASNYAAISEKGLKQILTLESTAGPRVYPLYYNIKKPFVLTKGDGLFQDEVAKVIGLDFWDTQKVLEKLQLTDSTLDISSLYTIILKQAGYDGVHVKNQDGLNKDYWVVFESNQIKSQFNVGTFDPTIDDIRYNIVPPKWTTADEAKLIIADMLESKTDLATTFAVLQSQLDPNLLKTLLDEAKSESELLTGIYNGIDKKLFSYNDKSGKWEIAKEPKKRAPRKPKKSPEKPIEPIKTPEQNEAEALADDSEVVTMENYLDLLTKFADELDTNKFAPSVKQNALRYIGKIWQGDKVKVLTEIESGQINSYAKLKKAILQRASKAEEKAEKAQFTTRLVRDPVTGIEKRIKVMVQQGETAEGATKEGIELKTAAPIGDGIVRENKEIFLDHAEAIASFVPDFLTNAEIELIGILRKTEGNNKEAGKELDVSEATISRRYNALLKKYGAFIREAEIDAEILQSPSRLKEASEAWAKNKNAAVKEATKDAPKPKNVVKKEKNKPAKPTPNVEEAGARILETAAKAAQLANTDPPSIPVPKTTTEPTMVRVTTELTGNQPEDVVRPEVQGDALIAGTDSSVKEAVKFTPKNPLKTSFQNSTDLEANPKKKAGLLAQAARGGFDAVVFQDGSMIPINKDDVVVVGRTESTTPPGIETVVTVTKEKGVPVKRTEPKPKELKAVADGAPVTTEKDGSPKPKTPEKKNSDVAPEDEKLRLERKINEDRDALRASGLDTSSLKQFLSFYWNKMKEKDKGDGQPYTDLFQMMWSKFVVLNDEINTANLALVGEEGIKLFWKKVDEIRAAEAAKMSTVPGYKKRADAQIFKDAAALVNEKFIPFVTPNELNIRQVGKNFMFTSKDKRIDALVRKDKVESDIPKPPTPPKKPDGTPDIPRTPVPEVKEIDRASEINSVLETALGEAEEAASMPLRASNGVGAVFGGSNRESANWWRQFMNWMRNTSQTASATGRTINSLQKKVRFISRLFDDVKAQTGHLAAAGKAAFRTALQCANDEGMMIARISKYQSELSKTVQAYPDAQKKLMQTIWRKLSEGVELTDADVTGAGIPTYLVTQVKKQSNDLLMVTRQINERMLELEAETGLVSTVDAEGNPVDPQKWATVQLDHEKLSRMSPAERTSLIKALVEARMKRKRKSEILDINTMIVMGWLDVAPSARHQGTALLARDRKIRGAKDISTSFSNDTLAILDTGIVHTVGTDPESILIELANAGEPDKFFVLQDGDVLRVYKMPQKLDDLSAGDKIKYLQAIDGDQRLYTSRWRTYLKNKNLIEYEMEEMLDFKTKRGYYSEYNSRTSSNIDRPLMRTGQDEQTALAVAGLIPEEVLDFPEIVNVMRTNLAESYFYFLKGRAFELLFQRELDRLLGTKGITIIDVLNWTRVTGEKDLIELGRSQNWSPDQLQARIADLNLGVSRLREEYAAYADTSPSLYNKEQYAARAGLAMMKMKVAPGYIISAMPELVMEFLKTNPIRIPREIVNLVRELMGDLRFSKSAKLAEDAGVLRYMLENFHHEHSNRLLGEVSHGAFELDNKLRTKFINSTAPIGMRDRTVRGIEVGARVAESIGSLQAMTNFVRGMGFRRWQARIWKHVSKGRITKLLEALEQPGMADLMNQLLADAERTPAAEKKLWKQFATEARKAGFGFEPQEAILFFKYGLNTKEKIKHLEYVIKKAGGNDQGLVNIDRMVDVYWQVRRNPEAGINPGILEETISSYANFLNDIVVRTTSPEPVGLGRITNLESKTSLGRLWYALTSWIRGFQDSVILNYASEGTLTYLAKNILLLGTVDTLIGLFREWLGGREQEDIVQEFEENPESFAIRIMKAAPIMGSMNGVLEAALGGLSALSGGTWQYYGNPMGSIGINAAGSTFKDVASGVTGLANMTVGNEDAEAAKVAASVGKIIPFNSLFNRSAVAVPARFIEDMDYLDQKGAVQQYLDLIQRDPYPYAKAQRKAGRSLGAAGGVTVPPAPRNIPKEQMELARQRTMNQPSEALKRTISINDQKGVSGRLGELLK